MSGKAASCDQELVLRLAVVLPIQCEIAESEVVAEPDLRVIGVTKSPKSLEVAVPRILGMSRRPGDIAFEQLKIRAQGP
jgi:hypothetical protein